LYTCNRKGHMSYHHILQQSQYQLNWPQIFEYISYSCQHVVGLRMIVSH